MKIHLISLLRMLLRVHVIDLIVNDSSMICFFFFLLRNIYQILMLNAKLF